MKSNVFGLDDIDPFLGFAGTGQGSNGGSRPPAEFGPSEDPFYKVTGDQIYGSYIAAGYDNTTAGSGADPAQAVAVTSGGITINVIYTSAALSAPQSFRDGIQKAVGIMAAAISDKITVNITVNWSGTGGGASAGPTTGYYEPYDWVRNKLITNASPGDTTFNALPTGTSIQGQANVAVWNAQLKLWGVIGANDTTTQDGSANFATDINPNLLVGVALHELTHAMGRIPYGSAPDIFDLYRFTSAGTRLFQGGATAPAAYFSLDGGVTKLADYGRNSDPSDFLNTGVQGPNDPFNEYYSSSTVQNMTAMDLKQLDALGFHLAANTASTIESYGSTMLVQTAGNYYLNPVAGGTGPTLKFNNAAVTVGQFSAFAIVAAEQVGSGYKVAWKDTGGANQFSIWDVDSSGNFTGYAVYAGNSTALENLETSFHQDLNNDGIIGVPAPPASTTIESFGVTSLVLSGNNYYFNPVAGGTGPTLKYGGSAVVAGQFSPFVLVGAEHTASGYEVAWKNASTNQFSIWQTDVNGNFTSYAVYGGTSTGLQAVEPSFHQDLNNDGVIGVPSSGGTTIEEAGFTRLVVLTNNYHLDSMTTGTGPTLKYGGASVTVGQFGAYTAVGVEQNAGGYEVAWKNASTNQFSIWQTDANGNFSSYAVYAGNSSSLQSLETSFAQDLNGDGVVGVPTAPLLASPTPAHTLAQDGSFLFKPDAIVSSLATMGNENFDAAAFISNVVTWAENLASHLPEQASDIVDALQHPENLHSHDWLHDFLIR